MSLTYSHTCRPDRLHLVPFQILCQLDSHSGTAPASKLIAFGRKQSELSFSAGLYSGSIVKAQRGLALDLCPARFVMWHEAR